MGKYYSPDGNFEVWEKMPKGYKTEEEWRKEHPMPEPDNDETEE